jgi:hypothetical protein
VRISASAEQLGIFLTGRLGWRRSVQPIRLASKSCAALSLDILEFFLQPLVKVRRRVPPVAKFTAVSFHFAGYAHAYCAPYLPQPLILVTMKHNNGYHVTFWRSGTRHFVFVGARMRPISRNQWNLNSASVAWKCSLLPSPPRSRPKASD